MCVFIEVRNKCAYSHMLFSQKKLFHYAHVHMYTHMDLEKSKQCKTCTLLISVQYLHWFKSHRQRTASVGFS